MGQLPSLNIKKKKRKKNPHNQQEQHLELTETRLILCYLLDTKFCFRLEKEYNLMKVRGKGGGRGETQSMIRLLFNAIPVEEKQKMR